jgi:hypothetical protein
LVVIARDLDPAGLAATLDLLHLPPGAQRPGSLAEWHATGGAGRN